MPDPRYHTAEHIIHGVIQNLFDGQVQNINFKGKKVRCDFQVETELSEDDFAAQVEAVANDIVERNLPVTFQTVTREEALKRCKTPRLPEDAETVRLSFIGDEIIIPCVGDHVASTGEVRNIQIRTCKKMGEDMIRLTFGLE